MPEQCIVAAFDGSSASRAAVSYAVRRAGAGGRVIVVHAFKGPSGRFGDVDFQRQAAAAVTRARELVDRLPEEVPGLGSADWAAEVVEGRAGGAISRVAEVEGATEIVLGTRGVGRARALLGSVAHDVLRRARCPVVVIPERAVAERSAADVAREATAS
jgi:nucleotide-binding universal stress UspA family protein